MTNEFLSKCRMDMAIDIFEAFIINEIPNVSKKVLSLFSVCLYPPNLENSDWHVFVIKIIDKYLGNCINTQ